MLKSIAVLTFYILGVVMCIVFSRKAMIGELREFIHTTPGKMAFIICSIGFILALDETLTKRDKNNG